MARVAWSVSSPSWPEVYFYYTDLFFDCNVANFFLELLRPIVVIATDATKSQPVAPHCWARSRRLAQVGRGLGGEDLLCSNPQLSYRLTVALESRRRLSELFVVSSTKTIAPKLTKLESLQ